MSFMDEFDHLRIQLEDIKLATDNFSPNKLIGSGGFGQVYVGELSLPEGQTTVAIKCLDRRFGQGNIEFMKEIVTLSKYKHKNLIKLLHFCIEGDESILVYEFASNKSLDCHLSDANLSWAQRLKICIGVADALNYLPDPMETHHRVLHRDIKSANILLDEEWSAKVSDFGLSKVGPANQTQTFLLSNAVGTPGYCDPSYWGSGVLSKKSDVYSFGVVLFEVLCGKLCCEYRDGTLQRIFVDNWRECFDGKRLGDIIFPSFKEQIEWDSLLTFAAIAYKCTNKDPKERPTMEEVFKELKVALEKHLGKLAEPSMAYEWQEELSSLLSEEVLNKDTTITGKAGMHQDKIMDYIMLLRQQQVDEVPGMSEELLNYVQSLQQQVELLSMKLKALNPAKNIDVDHLVSKEEGIESEQQQQDEEEEEEFLSMKLETVNPAKNIDVFFGRVSEDIAPTNPGKVRQLPQLQKRAALRVSPVATSGKRKDIDVDHLVSKEERIIAEQQQEEAEEAEVLEF